MRTRLLAIGLAVSLALNAFLVGYAVTVLTRTAPMRIIEPTPVELGLRIADILPEDAGNRLRGELRSLAPMIARHLRDYRQALGTGASIMGADEVDREALRQVVIEARDARGAIGDLLTDVLVETAAELPLEVRRELVSRFNLRRSEGN
jgi:uncharacterized membrane protein